MKRHKSLIPLSKFHRKVLTVSLMVKRNSPPIKGYPTEPLEKAAFVQDFYYHHLRHHFRVESDELFGTVWGKDDNLNNIIHEIQGQRKTITRLIDQLSAGGDLETKLDIIGAALEAHIRKEEYQFFPAIQEVMTEDELREIQLRINRRLRSMDRDNTSQLKYQLE
jgi:hemerythrin-like domain-containing protein